MGSHPQSRNPRQGLPSSRFRQYFGVCHYAGRQIAQLLVRDVPQDIVEALEQRAAEHGRSAEAEHRLILEEVLRPGRSRFWEVAAALRKETRGRISIPSEELIRQDRDER